MRDPWFQALFPSPPTVYGRRLLPYSLGHEMILCGLGNPIVLGGGDADVSKQDVLLACWVCSQDLAANRGLLAGDWRQIMRMAVHAWRWRRVGHVVALASFRQYMEDCSDHADHNRAGKTAGRGKGPAAPLAYHVVRVLCGMYGMGLDEAWNAPKGYALCLFDAWQESEGDDTMLTLAQMHTNGLVAQGNRANEAGDTAEAERLYAEAQRFNDAVREAQAQ